MNTQQQDTSMGMPKGSVAKDRDSLSEIAAGQVSVIAELPHTLKTQQVSCSSKGCHSH